MTSGSLSKTIINHYCCMVRHSLSFSVLVFLLSLELAGCRHITEFDDGEMGISGKYLFAGTEHALFRSSDNGDSWMCVDSSFETSVYVSIASNKTFLFAGCLFGGVIRSSDDGGTWTQVNRGLPHTSVWALCCAGPNTLAADDYGDKMLISTDHGNTWNQTGPAFTTVHCFWQNDSGLLAGTSNGPYRSTDNGKTWVLADTGFENIHFISIAHSGQKTIAALSDLGIRVSSDNGTTWTRSNTGLSSSVNKLGVSEGSVFACTNDGVFRSTDDGASWNHLHGLPVDEYVSFAAKAPYIFVSSYAHGVYRSSDHGETWVRPDSGRTLKNYVFMLGVR